MNTEARVNEILNALVCDVQKAVHPSSSSVQRLAADAALVAGRSKAFEMISSPNEYLENNKLHCIHSANDKFIANQIKIAMSEAAKKAISEAQ